MKKVLIVSYFFPPCNLTASQRAFSWAKYLHAFGYFPIVVTRRWDVPIKDLSDISKPTPPDIKHEKFSEYEVYYVPYKPNLRDKIFAKYGDNQFRLIRRLLTLIEIFLQNFFTAFIPYNNLFAFADELTTKDKSIQAVIISGNPFHQFKLGYLLRKRKGLKWIADYRDAWTTTEINFINRSILFRAISVVERFFEKKWVGTASLVTANSTPIADGITKLTGVQSAALYNGFIAEDFAQINPPKYAKFTITYVGTLSYGQKVEIFCEAYKRLIDETPEIQTQLLFPGLAFYKDQEQRIAKAMKGYEAYYSCTNRVERKAVLEMEKASHLLFYVAWDEQKGIIASKIYEYIASGTFILVTPTDKGSIEEIVAQSECGVCTASAEGTYSFLKAEYQQYLQGKYRINDISKQNVKQFSRVEQVKKLAEIFNSIEA